MIWVEVLGRHGVAQRVRAAKLPLVIGRGYQADVVLDDPQVDAAHVRLDEAPDGSLRLEDLGTVNGTHLEGAEGTSGRLVRGAPAPLPADGLLRVGQTRLRIVTGETPVPPAVPEPAGGGRLWRALTARKAAVLVPLAGFALGALDIWLADADGRAAESVAGDALGLLLAVAAWAGVWALAGRVNGRPPRFGAHHALAWAFVLAAGAGASVAEWGDAVLARDGAVALGVVASFGLFVVLLAAHLALATGAGRGRRVAVAVAAGGALALAAAVVERAETVERGDSLAISAALKPVPPALVRADTPDGFLARAAVVRRTVDRLAERDARRVRPGSRSGP